MPNKDTKDLQQLAKAIFELTRHDVWAGGKITGGHPRATSHGKAWPPGVQDPWNISAHGFSYGKDLTWTLSPEVDLAGHKVRVCVSWNGEDTCAVRVFSGGDVKYPGGKYTVPKTFWPWSDSWEWVLAKQERREGGKTGHVDGRDLLLKAAREAQTGVRTQSDEPLYCDLCRKAVDEVDEAVSILGPKGEK